MLSASEAFIAFVAPLVALAPVAEEVVDEVVEVVEEVEEVFVPAVPPSTAMPGRLTVAFAARAWKFARVRVAFAVGLFGLRQSQDSFGMRRRGRDILDVNNHRHSILAMLSLRTIQPHWRRVVDHNGICRCRHLRSCHGHESRIDTHCPWAVQSEGLAWLIEGGLRDGVVGGRELELYHVSYCCDDAVGVVGQCAVRIADLDDVDCDAARGGGGGGGGCSLCCRRVRSLVLRIGMK